MTCTDSQESATDQRPATTAPLGTASADRRPRLAWYLATTIVTVVFGAYWVVGLAEMLASGAAVGPLATTVGVLCTAALLGIQLGYFGRPSTDLRSRLSHVVLAAQAVLVYTPVLVLKYSWLGFPSFLAGSALLVLRPRFAWPLFAAIVAISAWAQYEATGLSIDVVYLSASVAGFALEVYLLTRLTRLVGELHRARSELAVRAVAEQRLAFARDLHDLLGFNLSDISLKGELAHRLITKSGERTRTVLAEIIDVSQRTLADVRAVARRNRTVSLEREARTAESLLTASDIAVRVELDHHALPARTRATLARVLREGVTDVLRQNDVRQCEIAVHQTDKAVSLDIVSSGALPCEPEADREGLDKLAEEVERLGGSLRSGRGSDERHRLHVEFPVAEETWDDEPAEDQGGRWSHGEARRIRALLATVLAGRTFGAVVHAFYLTREAWQIALTVGHLGALLALQLLYFSHPTARLRPPLAYGLLAVQAALIYLPLLALQEAWVSMPGMLAGSALLVLPPLAGWAVFAGVLGSVVGIQASLGLTPAAIVFNVTATVISGLVVFGLTWLTRLATELDATRRRLARAALAEERLRFARDLHDLLGMTLSAIALKSQLATRLLSVDHDRAAAELVDVLALTRQALADVRSVATGDQELSLEQEARSAEAVLVAADVQVTVDVEHECLPPSVRTVLAVVLREGVTNVLRHSKVEHCDISVRRTADGDVHLDIVNDGVGDVDAERADAHSPGSGIGNLSERVGRLGGTLVAGPEEGGTFRLHAALPVRALAACREQDQAEAVAAAGGTLGGGTLGGGTLGAGTPGSGTLGAGTASEDRADER
ncbi:sensor histidine kinase [Saccharothrix hoggarensis]|uniref:Sensor histidine kinase n=1 Tax=Saccharothrix hoggarensis TaxID=913853 RepID=A0ABW3R291_9PSEU